MPALAILQHGYPFAFECFRDKSSRECTAVAAKTIKGVEYLGIIVAIDCLSKPAEGTKFFSEPADVELIHRSLALAEPVHVNNCEQIWNLVIACKFGRLPNRSFRAFTVA